MKSDTMTSTVETIASECLAVRIRLLNRTVTNIFDDALRPLIAGLPILKIKLLNLDGLVVYSSDFRQIGESNSHDPDSFEVARQGIPTSKFHDTDNPSWRCRRRVWTPPE